MGRSSQDFYVVTSVEETARSIAHPTLDRIATLDGPARAQACVDLFLTLANPGSSDVRRSR